MKDMVNSCTWEEGFPHVYGHTSFSFLKRCQGFTEAKQGDMQAASMIVNTCVKAYRVTQLRENYPEAVLLPVMTKNRLPLALAEAIGLEVCTGVCEVYTAVRKDMSGMERLLHKPVFAGEIKLGREYILVDDIITQGGTVSALRKYVLGCGGQVCAVSALACSVGARVLTPAPNNILRLFEKFDYLQLTDILQYYEVADSLWELTDQQVKYLLRFKDIKGIEYKLAEIYMTLNGRCKARLFGSNTA